MHENETDTMVPALPAFAADVFRHLAPLDHPLARELSVSWLTLDRRGALEAKGTATAATPCREIGTQYPATRRAALRMGAAS